LKIAEVFYSVQGEGMLVGGRRYLFAPAGAICGVVVRYAYTSWQPESDERSIESIAEEWSGTVQRMSL